MIRQERIWKKVPSLTWFAIALTAALTLFPVAAARSDVDTDLRAGFYTDPDAVGFGVGMLRSASDTSPWYFNPNVEVAIADERRVFSLNADFHYDVATGHNQTFWFGGGPALFLTDYDRAGNDVDLGLNVLAGFGAAQGSVRPYVQLKGAIANDSRVAVMGGLRF